MNARNLTAQQRKRLFLVGFHGLKLKSEALNPFEFPDMPDMGLLAEDRLDLRLVDLVAGKEVGPFDNPFPGIEKKLYLNHRIIDMTYHFTDGFFQNQGAGRWSLEISASARTCWTLTWQVTMLTASLIDSWSSLGGPGGLESEGS